jgi:hypothetical protein
LKILDKILKLTLAGKATNKLSTLIKLRVTERSEAKRAKRRFASKIKIQKILTQSFVLRV